jgi:hypothetical protein
VEGWESCFDFLNRLNRLNRLSRINDRVRFFIRKLRLRLWLLLNWSILLLFVPMSGLGSGIICDGLDGLFRFLKPFRFLYWLRIILSYATGGSIFFLFLQFCSELLCRGLALRYLRFPCLYLLSRFNIHEYY